MKKNKMMRLASWLLVLTLLTTCIISGTFAKYVTSDEAEDTARVARWGVTTTISGTLFGEHYNALSADEKTSNQISADYTGSVDSHAKLAGHNGENIVAPGTKSENMEIRISGAPEVKGKIDVEVKDTEGKNFSDIWLAGNEYGVMVDVTDTVKTNDDIVGLYKKGTGENEYVAIEDDDKFVQGTQYFKLMDVVNMANYALGNEMDDPRYISDDTNGNKYYPIVWNLSNTKSGGAYEEGVAIHHVAELKGGINGIIGANSTFNSNTDLAAQVGNITINWEWPFENSAGEVIYDENGDLILYNNVIDGCDTILGKLMAWNSGSNYQVVKITTTTDSAGEETTTTYTGVTVAEETIEVEGEENPVGTGVTYAKVGEGENAEKVACLTVGFNIKVTVSQVD